MKRTVWMLLSKVVVGSGVTCNKSILKPQNKRNPPPPPPKKKNWIQHSQCCKQTKIFIPDHFILVAKLFDVMLKRVSQGLK